MNCLRSVQKFNTNITELRNVFADGTVDIDVILAKNR